MPVKTELKIQIWALLSFEQSNITGEQRISLTVFFSLSLPDETINSENLNGHATSNVTSEEVKVHIESPEPLLEEQATGPVKTEDKTGNFWL